MTDVTTHLRSTSSKPARIARWTLQVLLAAVFLAAGAAKLAGAPPMVAIFEQIGIGQWFRYLTGIVEITGSVLLVWPSRSVFGAVLLACTMGTALLVHFLRIGGNWVPAAVLFVLSLVTLWTNRTQLRAAMGVADSLKTS